MRSRTVYDKHGNVKYEWVDGVLTYAAEEYAGRVHTHMVMPDIAPYQSMADGTMIESRSKHQEHLARHGMRVVEPGEIGAKPAPKQDSGIKQEYVSKFIHGMTHEERKAAVRREVDFINWNSNGLPRSQ